MKSTFYLIVILLITFVFPSCTAYRDTQRIGKNSKQENFDARFQAGKLKEGDNIILYIKPDKLVQMKYSHATENAIVGNTFSEKEVKIAFQEIEKIEVRKFSVLPTLALMPLAFLGTAILLFALGNS